MKRPCAAAFFLLAAIAACSAAGQGKRSACVYIVTVRPPATGVNSEWYQMHILATALGSEERARQALLYSYKTVMSGFAAKLTPAQLAALKKHPDVLQALPEVKYSLHGDNNININN
ncbi:hypothetical protein QOZ80_UnG0722210 [Eleusine coracana subsp. coracana]|uniref:Inhibitor I9 domain-containing protein n=1 Tax=Eleusine coracana subsp. coracana TaxID=191504 RepID=A0AAV9FVX3_ELECO|nr:hypothetical protein QOZ80_UnG0722210 [Eleusine coracana subsp. coracana]